MNRRDALSKTRQRSSSTSSSHRHRSLRTKTTELVDTAPESPALRRRVTSHRRRRGAPGTPKKMKVSRGEKEAELANRVALPDLRERETGLLGLKGDIMDALKIVKPLGTGAFGVVFLVEHVQTKHIFAMKKMAKSTVRDGGQRDHVMEERRVLFAVDHPFIVRAVDTFVDRNYLYTFFEYCPGGELFSRMRMGTISLHEAAFYVGQVALALRYLHSLAIVYRDMKPENIVLDRQGYVRLIDFGFAKRISAKSWSLVGTAEYLAPEAVAGAGTGVPADWWGLGCLLYEMLVGKTPFAGEGGRAALCGRIEGQEAEMPSSMDKTAAELCEGLLLKDPDMRFGWDEVAGSDMFQTMDWGSLEAKRLEAPWVPNLDAETDARYYAVSREDLMRHLGSRAWPGGDDDLLWEGW